MFHLIGLGLSEKSISLEALEAIKKCDKVYLENYTVDFPYEIKGLEKAIGKKVIELNREKVEGEEFLNEAKKQEIALLIYGDILSATTHCSILETCKSKKIPFKLYHNASILTAIAETGLHLYKFGKTASLPKWLPSFKPKSFMEIIEQNQKIKAHTLLLVDISLEFKDAKQQLKESGFKNEKIIVCSQLGYKSKIYYGSLNEITEKIKKPYCIIIPSEMHFTEKDLLLVSTSRD